MHQGFQSSLIPGVSVGRRFFFFYRRDKGTMWGRRKARAICRVSKSLLDAGKVPECRSAAAKPYDLRQVCSTVRNRSECRSSLVLYLAYDPRSSSGSLPAEHAQPSQLKACAASDPWACVRRVRPSVVSGGCSNCRKNRRRGARTSSWM